ncbi:UNVERIFIED_CONTAM: hypothetical protein Slati_4459600 [Sesamum latifolium]|uniref:DUF4283 domain-containing protein n=1 Tax=Sesamum latifolium TaxID=2727402 RepID=A0AAW2SR76_9LAMI
MLLFKFNHIIDRDRALKGYPWSFDKHVLILSSIRADENPMHVDLNCCDLYVHVHDLPLSHMNLGVVGNMLGGSITPPRPKIPTHNLARDEDATSKDPEDGQTLVKETVPSIPHAPEDRDNQMGENMMLIDSILSLKASSKANMGRLARLDQSHSRLIPADLVPLSNYSTGALVLAATDLTDIPF